MTYQTLLLPHFKKQLKPLLKKYRDIGLSLKAALNNFEPKLHILIRPEIYKIRLATKSLSKGKSGSFRLYIYVLEIEEQIVPITIYFKGDRENLTLGELEKHAQIILSELQVTS